MTPGVSSPPSGVVDREGRTFRTKVRSLHHRCRGLLAIRTRVTDLRLPRSGIVFVPAPKVGHWGRLQQTPKKTACNKNVKHPTEQSSPENEQRRSESVNRRSRMGVGCRTSRGPAVLRDHTLVRVRTETVWVFFLWCGPSDRSLPRLVWS